MENKKTKRQIQHERKIERCRRFITANIHLTEVQRENEEEEEEEKEGRKGVNKYF